MCVENYEPFVALAAYSYAIDCGFADWQKIELFKIRTPLSCICVIRLDYVEDVIRKAAISRSDYYSWVESVYNPTWHKLRSTNFALLSVVFGTTEKQGRYVLETNTASRPNFVASGFGLGLVKHCWSTDLALVYLGLVASIIILCRPNYITWLH